VTRVVIDFTSSSYLGLRHTSNSLRPWAQLTSGVPAALAEPEAASALAADLAALIGTDAAVLATSTLHAFWDLFVVRAGLTARAGAPGVALYLDAASYPISRWGVERAAALGIPCTTVPHHDPGALRRILARSVTRGRRPVMVADGLCPGCGRATPVGGYLQVCRSFGGELVLDDTQPLGVLGYPRAGACYGQGGGGSLRHAGVRGPDIILVSSLAKGFGVPLTVVGGSTAFINGYQELSETRMHCSPPSFAHLAAGARALSVNRITGEHLRTRLAGLVDRFQRGLRDTGLPVPLGRFPVQSVSLPPPLDPVEVHQVLLRLGVRGVLHRPQCLGSTVVSFLITAGHSASDVDAAVSALGHAAAAALDRAAARADRLVSARGMTT
jgi:8-amino-7-oxononanoate synthase